MVLGVMLAIFLRSRGEPLYEDRALSACIIEARYGAPLNKDNFTGPYNEQVCQKAKEAIRAIGVNGVPFYLRWITDEPSALRRRIVRLFLKYPSIPRPISIYGREPSDARGDAVVWGVIQIGTNATPAVPKLTRILFKTQTMTVRERAAAALGFTGLAAVPALRKAAVDPDPRMRFAAVMAMGKPWSDYYLDTLFERLSDSNEQVSAAASRMLVSYCYRSESHFRLLTNALTHPKPELRIMAIAGLERHGGTRPRSYKDFRAPPIPRLPKLPGRRRFVCGIRHASDSFDCFSPAARVVAPASCLVVADPTGNRTAAAKAEPKSILLISIFVCMFFLHSVMNCRELSRITKTIVAEKMASIAMVTW